MESILAGQEGQRYGAFLRHLDVLDVAVDDVLVDQGPAFKTEQSDDAFLAAAFAEVVSLPEGIVLGDWAPAYVRHRSQLARRVERFGTGVARRADHVAVITDLSARGVA